MVRAKLIWIPTFVARIRAYNVYDKKTQLPHVRNHWQRYKKYLSDNLNNSIKINQYLKDISVFKNSNV